MSTRKYRHYLIQVTHFNGLTDDIEYTDNKNIDQSNYSEMLEMYRKTKEKYSDTRCKISFLGMSEDEQISVMYEKEIIPSRDNVNQYIEHPDDLADEYLDLAKRIVEAKQRTNEALSFCDKEISRIYHDHIECIDGSDITNTHKINTFNELRELYLIRRDYKNRLDKFDSIRGKCSEKSATKLENDIDKKNIESKNATKNIIKQTKRKDKCYEVKYSNFQDRMRLMRELKLQYKTIHNDSGTNTLMCYGKKF